MPEKPETSEGKDPSFKPLIRSLALEAVFYTPLAIGYFLFLQRFAKEPLIRLDYNLTMGFAIFDTLLVPFTHDGLLGG
jgi:hypothetical protein